MGFFQAEFWLAIWAVWSTGFGAKAEESASAFEGARLAVLWAELFGEWLIVFCILATIAISIIGIRGVRAKFDGRLGLHAHWCRQIGLWIFPFGVCAATLPVCALIWWLYGETTADKLLRHLAQGGLRIGLASAVTLFALSVAMLLDLAKGRRGTPVDAHAK